MGKKLLLHVVLLAFAVGAQAQETPPPQEKTRSQEVARPDSLPVLQKLNQDRSALPAAGAPTSGKGVAAKKEEAVGEEIDLGTFSIQAVIEKPNVDIIPKRTEPDWEEARFLERSFGHELKEVPDELMLIDEELDRAQRLETLKKADPPEEEKKK
ncbi:MAG: hypothetical protein ACREOO_04355 [bacterium]